VQELALAADQASVDPEPLATLLGLALSVTVGSGAVTDTVADCEALPPAPVQVIEYVALELRGPVDCDPVSALVPLQPPEPVHAVALLDDHVRVELWPAVIALGPTLSVTVGAALLTVTVADCEAVPPGPVQVKT